MRDLGELKYILGLEIKRDRSKHKIYVSQHKHTLDILRRFNHDHSRPVVTPLDSTTTLSKVENMSQEEKDYMSSVPYLSAVGSLMYLAIGSRPDIAFAVGCLIYLKNLAILNPVHSPFTWTINLPSRSCSSALKQHV